MSGIGDIGQKLQLVVRVGTFMGGSIAKVIKTVSRRRKVSLKVFLDGDRNHRIDSKLLL